MPTSGEGSSGPRTIGVLVDFTGSATEWTFFCVEMVSGYAFLRYKDWLEPPAASDASPVDSTRGAWLQACFGSTDPVIPVDLGNWPITHNVWSGLTPVGVIALADRRGHGDRRPWRLVWSSTGVPLGREARRAHRPCSLSFWPPMVLMPFLGAWFLASMPPDSRSCPWRLRP